MTTFHIGGQKDVSKEAAIKLYKEAAEYAGLPCIFNIGDKKRYNPINVIKYNAYIAGYVSALTTPITENKEEDIFAQTEVYLEEQL